jgi:alginate O-acetyltransferase complex protein AlgI
MLFNSWEFLILLLITLPLYYLPVFGGARRVWQVSLLLVASAVFYAWEEPRLLILLFTSCLFNAVAVERILFWKKVGRTQPDPPTSPSSAGGSLLRESFRRRLGFLLRRGFRRRLGYGGQDGGQVGESVAAEPCGESANEESKEPCAATDPCASTGIPKHRNTETPARNARLWLFWTVALNLGFLAFFKYAGFLAGLFPETPTTEALKHWVSGIPLPVGISFYTFQGISMVVDVWRDDISQQTRQRLSGRGKGRFGSIHDTSFYIAFFPQLVAGPIVKAHEFIDQIGSKMFRDIDWLTVRRGLILGYFLKVFVADNMSESTVMLSTGFDLEGGGPINLMSLLYGYSLQIFADFAGYSLIAIGLGELFGYKLPPNFHFPYLSTSITEFWRRWHLSLSSWLRDYLYIPLGGNRKGTGRTYFNLFLVMFLGGLWHGAAWKFAIWGSLHGVFLAAERLGGAVFRKGGVSENRKESKIPSGATEPCASSPKHRFTEALKHCFKWLLTFHLVTLLWLTFMMPDMASIVSFFKGVANAHFKFSGPPIFSLAFYGSAVVLYHAWGWLREHREGLALKLLRSPIEPLVQGIMIFLVVTNPGAPRGFIYFQF